MVHLLHRLYGVDAPACETCRDKDRVAESLRDEVLQKTVEHSLDSELDDNQYRGQEKDRDNS